MAEGEEEEEEELLLLLLLAPAGLLAFLAALPSVSSVRLIKLP